MRVDDSWWRRARARRRARHTAPAWTELPLTPALGDPLGELTITQLCGLWRKSRAGLASAATPELRLQVVTARAALLAELERRDPVAMAAWLAAGGDGEPDGPAAYLLGAVWHRTGER